ncbi:MAG: nuclear transport factor 2 family protein [Chitinophagaceae bacterium]|nr:nuclear transport factor 2 family protein [Chitinophagaceae bacterium]
MRTFAETAVMKTLLSFALVLLVYAGNAQHITGLVEAENNFAKYAVDHNVKEAFLRFMDTAAIVFEKGEIKKASATWQARPANNTKIIWEPAFAIVSAGGDLGITTGPWYVKVPVNDTVRERGAFSTVWIKKDSADWKFLVDIGIDHNVKTNVKDVSLIELTHKGTPGYDAQRFMLQSEQNFITNYKNRGKAVYNEVADADIRFLTNGFAPVSMAANMNTALANIPDGIAFEAVGSGVSKDGDLGYVYGYATLNGKKENYMRVWRRVGRKWTLLLQTLTL